METALGLSGIMFGATYLAGSIPLLVTLSEERLRLLSTLGAGLLVGAALAVIIPEAVHSLYSPLIQFHAHSHHHEHEHAATSPPISPAAAPLTAATVETVPEVNHALIGGALLVGFLLMLFIDQLGHSHSRDGSSTNTATVGLVVHSAADGLAMGAALSSTSRLTAIVFVAIMLHKAPAALGLVSFLLHANVDKWRIRRHLLAFSVAAPILTIATAATLSFGVEWLRADTVALALLFSAGTFLYVATVHVLGEVTAPSGQDSKHKHLSWRDMICISIGAVLPSLMTFGHSHD